MNRIEFIRKHFIYLQFIIGVTVLLCIVITLLIAYQIKIIKKHHKQLIITLLGDLKSSEKRIKPKNV